MLRAVPSHRPQEHLHPSPAATLCAAPSTGAEPGAPGRRLPPSPNSGRCQAAGQSAQGPLQPSPGRPRRVPSSLPLGALAGSPPALPGAPLQGPLQPCPGRPRRVPSSLALSALAGSPPAFPWAPSQGPLQPCPGHPRRAPSSLPLGALAGPPPAFPWAPSQGPLQPCPGRPRRAPSSLPLGALAGPPPAFPWAPSQGPLQPSPGRPRSLDAPRPLALPASHYLPVPVAPLSAWQALGMSVWPLPGPREINSSPAVGVRVALPKLWLQNPRLQTRDLIFKKGVRRKAIQIALNIYIYIFFSQPRPHKYLKDSGTRLPGFKSQLCQGHAV